MSNQSGLSRPPIVRGLTQSSPAVPQYHARRASETSGNGTFVNGDQINNITNYFRKQRWRTKILVVLSVAATAVAGGICGTGHCTTSTKENVENIASSASTSIPTNTQQSSISTLGSFTFTATHNYTPTIPTISSQSVSNTLVTASSTQSPTCIGGTGKDNYLGLCDFSCHYNYCPSPPPYRPFNCTACSAIVTPPSTVTMNGVPVQGEDQSYIGLCSYACAHGYCPPSACVAT